MSYSKLFMDEESSDLKLSFLCEDANRTMRIVFPGHSFVLRRCSEVFKAMLQENGFRESNTREVNLQFEGEFNLPFFILKYCYTEALEELDLNVHVQLLKMAHMYKINGLLEICESRIISGLKPNTVCKIYENIKIVASESLMQSLMDFMFRCAFIIFHERHHTILTQATMAILLMSDELCIINENQVLEAVWVWGQLKCAAEGKLGSHEVKQAINNLSLFIRWSKISDVDKNSPWSDLVEEKIQTVAEQNCRTVIKKEPLMNKIAKVLDLYNEGLVFKSLTSTAEPFLFSVVHNDMYLVGFTFEITTENVFQETQLQDKLNCLVNGKNLNSSSMKSCLKHRNGELYCNTHDKTVSKCNARCDKHVQYFYTYQVEVEMLCPVLLKRSYLNILDVRPRQELNHKFQFSKFSLPSNEIPRRPAVGGSSTHFSIASTPVSVIKIFHFPAI